MMMSVKNDEGEKTGSLDDRAYTAVVHRVSLLSMIGNLVLAVFKFLAGIIGRSSAMISDAVHSSSDILGSLIVMIGAHVSGKEADREHPYGHERFECVASILLSFILFLAGAGMIREGWIRISSGSYKSGTAPGMIALIAAVCSIVVKEGMYRYTIGSAKRIGSDSLKAEAWHHRSDAFSSVGSLIGIAGSRMGMLILDPLAGMIISLFILEAAFSVFKEAVDKMTDHAGSADLEEQIRQCVSEDERIRSIDLLKTREFGRKVYLDLEIGVDSGMSLGAAHEIAEETHDTIEHTFPQIKHVMIHVNPA